MTIFIDFDNTVVESNKRIIEMINDKYGLSKTEEDLKDYNFQSIYPISVKEKIDMFESDSFYDNLDFKPGFENFIKNYASDFEIVFVSNGTTKNNKKKKEWLKTMLPYQNWNFDFIGIGEDNSFLNKSRVDMSGAIQIDDCFDCLLTNASIKVLYKDFNNFKWQQPSKAEDYLMVNTWEEIGSILDFYKEYDCDTLTKK